MLYQKKVCEFRKSQIFEFLFGFGTFFNFFEYYPAKSEMKTSVEREL